MEVCSLCEGSGLRVLTRPDGSRFAKDCDCRIERRAARMIAKTNIPRRYEHCTLDSYETGFHGATRSLKSAHLSARKFVESYPLETQGTGLLLTGSIGVGKTHLAVGILQALVAERGATGLFYDYRELLKQVQNSYNKQVQATELEILRPVFEAEVLVLDELGASKPTDWVWDTVAHILNTRYNDRRTTIITTNYANAGPLGSLVELGQGETARARAASREETLGDRIGERMRSRLQEMCVVVEMHGVDFRQTVNLARFG
jgi:DNA replication protein DnaC